MISDFVKQMSSIDNLKPTISPIEHDSLKNNILHKNSHNIIKNLTIIFVIGFLLLFSGFLCLYFNFRSMHLSFLKFSKKNFEAYELVNLQSENVEATAESLENFEALKTGTRKKVTFGMPKYKEEDVEGIQQNEAKIDGPKKPERTFAILNITSSKTLEPKLINVSPSNIEASNVIPLNDKVDESKIKRKMPYKKNIFGWFFPSLPPQKVLSDSSSKSVDKTISNTETDVETNSPGSSNFENINITPPNDPVDL